MDLKKLNEKRFLVKDVFKLKSKRVEVAGWVHNTRGLGKIRFLLLRDVSGIIQVTAVKGKVGDEIFKSMNNVSRESVVYVKGVVKIQSRHQEAGKLFLRNLKF